MATIRKKGKKYQVIIRKRDGFPHVYKTLPTKQEAIDWGVQEEAKRLQGIYFSERDKKHTLNELIERYFLLILPSKLKNVKDITRHLQWWKQQLGSYALNAITPDMVAKCRQQLAMGLTPKGTRRKPATVNRYIASLSALFSYGVKRVWMGKREPCHAYF